MRVHVLGPLQVAGADAVLGPRDRVVLSALVVNLGEPVEASALAEAMWGEHPPPTWPKVVQGCVSRLRRVLGTGAIETTTHGYLLARESVSLDIEDFEGLVVRARERAAQGAPEQARSLYADALALWRGAPFDALDDWLPGRLEAVRLRELRLAAQEEQLQARLDAGEHREVATEATVLAGEQPYRERRWALLALAQYRSGRQADALSSIRTARRVLGRELGLDPGPELIELEAAILAQDPALATAHEARIAAAACPWKGLASYQAEDHDIFFGRGADIAACLDRLREFPLLVLTGPSGCGKTSLLHAGLVPALRRRGRRVETFTPGTDGPMAMSVALAGGLNPLLVIDQFEEAFTLGGAQAAWLGEIAKHARDRAPVVLAVRADHLAQLGEDAELARLTEQGLHLVAPLTGPDLREAIDGPARLSGLRLEPGLVDLVLRDAEGQPGALPLLSHALAETWRRRESGVLTVDGYRDAGGIRDAVAASADRLYESLTPAQRGELRWLILRMVSLSDTGEPFRTQLPVEVTADPQRRRLLDLLVRSRLVTSDADAYELAHEALARVWPRLRTWLDEDAGGQRLRRHLRLAAAGWESLGRPESELYRGARLEAVLEWCERENEPIGSVEADFVAASRADAEGDLRRLGEQARQQRVQNRRLRLVASSAVALLLVAVLAASSAVSRGREADRQRDAAAAAATVARHEAMVERSLALRSSNRTVGALLAVEAWRRSPDVLSWSALIGTLTSAVGFLGYRRLELGENASGVAVPGSDRVLATAGGGAVAFVDPATGRSQRPSFKRVFAAGGADARLVISANGNRAAQLVQSPNGSMCPTSFGRPAGADQGCWLLVVYDLGTRRPVMGPVPAIPGATALALSADGRTVAVTGGHAGDLVVWDVDTGTRRHRLPGLPGKRGADTGGSVTFAGASRILVGSAAGWVREISALTLEVERSFRVPSRSANRAIVRTPRGGLLLVGDRGAVLLNLKTGRVGWRADIAMDGDDPCYRVAVAEASNRFYCGGSSGLVVERDLSSGQRTGVVLTSQLGTVNSVVLSADETELIVFTRHWDMVARWRTDAVGLGSRVVAPGMVATSGYDPTGRFLLTAPKSRPHAGRVLATDGRVVLQLPLAGDATWLSQTTVAVLGPDPGLVDLPSGVVRRIAALGPSTLTVHPEPEGAHAWSVTRTATGSRVVRFSLATGRPTGSAFETDRPVPVHVSANGETVLVTMEGMWTREYDIGSGALLGIGLNGAKRTALGGDGTVFAVSGQGDVEAYAAVYFQQEAATFPRSLGPASSLQLSEDERRLMVTSNGGSVHIYDTATQVALVGALWGLAAAERPAGWLRPDGKALLVSTPAGVVEWNLEPKALVKAVCDLAGRNMTRDEWAANVGDRPYVRLCAGYPTGLTTV